MARLSRKIIFSIVCFVLLVFVFVFYIIPYPMATYFMGIHQKAITSELAEWEKEYSEIKTYEEAFGVICKLDYISIYYTPGEGYHSNPDIEQKLESQRQKTKDAMLNALKVFLGKGKEFDIEAWDDWRIAQRIERNIKKIPTKSIVEVKVLDFRKAQFDEGAEKFYGLKCIVNDPLGSDIPRKSLLVLVVTKNEQNSGNIIMTDTSLSAFEIGQIYKATLLEGVPQGWTSSFVEDEFERNSAATFACLKIEVTGEN